MPMFSQADANLHVIVGWISIDESVEKKAIEGESPVRRAGLVGMVGVDRVVVQWIGRYFVHVQVPIGISLVIAESACNGRGTESGQKQHEQLHRDDTERVYAAGKACRSLAALDEGGHQKGGNQLNVAPGVLLQSKVVFTKTGNANSSMDLGKRKIEHVRRPSKEGSVGPL